MPWYSWLLVAVIILLLIQIWQGVRSILDTLEKHREIDDYRIIQDLNRETKSHYRRMGDRDGWN